jgi:hypothetical protein
MTNCTKDIGRNEVGTTWHRDIYIISDLFERLPSYTNDIQTSDIDADIQ